MTTPSGTRQFDRERAFETVVKGVEQALTEGRYPVGSRLPSERELAEVFGVSRVVIREATRFLESRGFVSVRRGSGTYVRDVDVSSLSQEVTLQLELKEASLAELYVVRQSLEVTSVRLAVENATDDLVMVLEARVHAMKAIAERGIRSIEDYMGRRAEDEAFHLAIASAAGNTLLFRLIEAVLPMCSMGHYQILRNAPSLDTFLSPEKISAINEEHALLALAIKNRDSRAAEVFITSQMQRSIAHWLATGKRSHEKQPSFDPYIRPHL